MSLRDMFSRLPFPRRRRRAGMEELVLGDMRTTPIDNPLDVRADGSIRPGDPAWAFLEEVMRTGQPGIATQRRDGTWDAELLPDRLAVPDDDDNPAAHDGRTEPGAAPAGQEDEASTHERAEQ